MFVVSLVSLLFEQQPQHCRPCSRPCTVSLFSLSFPRLSITYVCANPNSRHMQQAFSTELGSFYFNAALLLSFHCPMCVLHITRSVQSKLDRTMYYLSSNVWFLLCLCSRTCCIWQWLSIRIWACYSRSVIVRKLVLSSQRLFSVSLLSLLLSLRHPLYPHRYPHRHKLCQTPPKL